jgi:hypothetical protein
MHVRAVVAAMLALAVGVLGVTACSPSKAQVAAQHQQQCFNNEHQTKLAIDLVHADSGVYPDVKNVVAELKLRCPDGGTYSYDPNTDIVTCSVHGHPATEPNIP